MNKCSLINDLLPLYIEDMLSEESKEFVKEHLASCQECDKLYQMLKRDEEKPSLEENQKEKTVTRALKGYRKWFYTLLITVIISSLLGGVIGTYTVLKYEELIPTNIARDFVTYALPGDRWVYQEKLAPELVEQLTFDQYFDWESWEDVESYTNPIKPTGFKVYKDITAQEFGPIDVSLRVGLVLTGDGFKVFNVTINDKEEYLKKKEQYLSELDRKGNPTEGEVYNIEIRPTNPLEGEYFVEGRILEINDNTIEIEQHYDTGIREVPKLTVDENTLVVKHSIVNNADYFDKIDLEDLKVGDILAIIFTKEDVPRAIILAN